MAALRFETLVHDEWRTEVIIPVQSFDEAALALAEFMWQVHGDMLTVIEYDEAFRNARDREECLCGIPGCGNVILPVTLMDGSLAAIMYAA